MPNMVCLVTGPIVGLRSTWFLEDTVEFAAALGKEIKVYSLFEEILRIENIKSTNVYEKAGHIGEILNGYQYQFKDLREKAYLSIARQIDRLPEHANAAIRIPASVGWRGVNIEFKDHRIIAEQLKPDRIVTLIDAEWKVMERLQKEYGRHVLSVVAHQKELTLEKILGWLASEVSMSEDWAEWASYLTRKEVRHFVLGMETPSREDRERYVRDVDNMAKLICESEIPSFYASYSMTVATEEIRKQINELVWRLRSYGVVIDPASIEIGANVDARDRDVVFAFTIWRDIRWDLQKVDIVAAFHPYTEMPPLSTGMMDELGHARAFRKERYLVLPVGSGSPFTGGNYVPFTHLFEDGSDFFAHIEKKRVPPLKPRFSEYVEEFAKWQKERIHADVPPREEKKT